MASMLWIGGKPLGAAELWSNLLLVQTFTGFRSWPTPLWTLPYELLMYLFLPALFVFARRSISRMLTVYLAALALAAGLWATSIYPIFIGFTPCFLAGALAYFLSIRTQPFVGPWVLFSVVGIGVALIAWCGLSDFKYMPLFWLLCLSTGIVISLCREITFRPLVAGAATVARYSYGIYLTHITAMGLTLMGDGAWYWRVMAFAALQAALAITAYRLIEAPGMRYGAKLAQRMTNARTAANTGAAIRP
jgi:peptidoglycan/LPS O-acetylase OafA/YrhL